MDTSTNIGLGHNRPPQTTADDLADRYKSLADRFLELTEAAKAAPETIEDDENHLKVVELCKEMRTCERAAENAQEEERLPFKTKVEAINGWFKSRIEPLAKLRATLTARHKDYSDKKAAAEKARLEAEAEERRAREREALRLANEAQASAIAANNATEDARRLAEEAKAQREAATTDLETATADHADARAESGRLWAKILEIDASIAKRRKEGEKITAEHIAAEKGDLPEQYDAARKAVSAADAKVKEARQAAVEAKRRQQEAEREEEDRKRKAAQANRQVQQHMGDAIREDKAAKKLEDRAAGPEADLVRARSEHGAVGTVARQWQSEVVDRAALDKEALWPFLHGDAIASALHKWMLAQPPHKRVMRGARMTEELVGQVR